jgi:hypothetical protein
MSNMGGHFLVFLIRTLKITFFVSGLRPVLRQIANFKKYQKKELDNEKVCNLI